MFHRRKEVNEFFRERPDPACSRSWAQFDRTLETQCIPRIANCIKLFILNHQEAEQLVQKIVDDSGHFIEIVNYNVRGRQYSVTGEVEGLDILENALEKTTKGSKKAYIEVPGIDVPFHSRLLVKGVDDFRDTLESVFPKTIDPQRLIGRYIPNLTATSFRLEREFVQEILDVVDS